MQKDNLSNSPNASLDGNAFVMPRLKIRAGHPPYNNPQYLPHELPTNTIRRVSILEVFFADFATTSHGQIIVLNHDNLVGKPVAMQPVVDYHIGLGKHGFLYSNK